MQLSDESKLLIENWDAYQDVLTADKKLRGEMQAKLLSIENKLRACDWWDSNWNFHVYGVGQIYISHISWVIDKSPLIWIGIEGVTPERVFGDDPPPQRYLYINGGQDRLCEQLRSVLASNTGGFGAIASVKNYVVQAPSPKCLPEALDNAGDTLFETTLLFFEHFAKFEPLMTQAVKETGMKSNE